MGWGVGWDGRWVGYMVPAECDMPGCTTQIDRGLSYKCEEVTVYRYFDSKGVEVTGDDDWETETDEQEEGCGLFFCGEHEDHNKHGDAQPKGEHPRWMYWILNHESWAQWRLENPADVEQYRELTKDYTPPADLLEELRADG